MIFKSRTEAYSYAILVLSKLLEKFETSVFAENQRAAIRQGIEQIKIAIENHEQQPQIVADILQKIQETPGPIDWHPLERLQDALLANKYQQSLQDKFRNPLARRLESEIAITLLLQPTTAMMTSVGRVSTELLKFLSDKESNWSQFKGIFKTSWQPIALGSFENAPSYKGICKILRDNQPEDLPQILFIHYILATYTRTFPINHAPTRGPIGQFSEIIKEFVPPLKGISFFEGIRLQGTDGDYYRHYIGNIVMYKSALYRAPGNRGREGAINEEISTSQLGLFLPKQRRHASGLPYHSSDWCADCQSQKPDFKTAYVLDLINNDAIYVAGPSGMTSVFLGQMETLGNFETEALKQNYLSAIVAYTVSGGFHSIHEIIGPAQYVLRLVPGYHIQVPVTGTLAPAPNYNHFFEQQTQIDSEFAACRELAWQQYLDYFAEIYAPDYLDASILEHNASLPTEIPVKYSPMLFPITVVDETNKEASAEQITISITAPD